MVSLGVWGNPIIIDGPPKDQVPPISNHENFGPRSTNFAKTVLVCAANYKCQRAVVFFTSTKFWLLWSLNSQFYSELELHSPPWLEKILKTQCFQVAKTALKIVSFSKLPLILNMSFHMLVLDPLKVYKISLQVSACDQVPLPWFEIPPWLSACLSW